MEHTKLGNSDIVVPRIGFGGCPMGGHGWGDVDRKDLLDSIAWAMDNGINFFDTADTYGLGQSERTLAEGLRGRRDKAVIATKFGVRVLDHTVHDNRPKWIRAALDASLRRLQTDYIDIYQLHYWDAVTPFEDIAAVLEESAVQGKIRCWGVTNVGIEGAFARHATDQLVTFSHELSLAKRAREEEILKTIRDFGTTFLAWGSLGQGILTGKYDATHRFAANDRRARDIYVNFNNLRERNLLLVETMRDIQRRHPSRSLAQIALRWILDRIPGSVALVGINRPSQIQDAAGTLGWTLTAEDIALLNSVSKTEVPLAPVCDE